MKVCINFIKSMRFTTSPHLNPNIWACHVHHGASLLFRFWAHFHSLQEELQGTALVGLWKAGVHPLAMKNDTKFIQKIVLFLIKCGLWDFFRRCALPIFLDHLHVSGSLMGMPTSSNSNHNECLTVGLWVWIVAAYTSANPDDLQFFVLRFYILVFKTWDTVDGSDIRFQLTT